MGTLPVHDDATAIRRVGDVDVLVWSLAARLGVDAVVTTRHGGVSTGPYRSLNLGLHVGDDPEAVQENRRRAALTLGAGVDDLVFGAQVHGTRAEVVTSADAGRGSRREDDAFAGTDALVTRTAGPVLVTLVADCAPVLLVDPDTGVLATVHAGWRGAVAGTVAAALEAMSSIGGRPSRTVAWIGPSVPVDTYEVGPEVADAAVRALGPRTSEVLVPRGDRWHFDVPGANRLQLVAAGVPDDNVHLAPYGTDDGNFFSDRAVRPCGRFGLLARLR